MKEKQNSKVLSLRVSNKTLASCIEFEELTTGFVPKNLNSCVNLLLNCTVALLKERGILEDFSEINALKKIEEFLLTNGKTSIGRKELIKKGEILIPNDLVVGSRKKELIKETFSPEIYKEETLPLPFGKQKEINEDKKEKEILNAYDSQIEEDVEMIQVEDNLNLLKSIFIDPIKK